MTPVAQNKQVIPTVAWIVAAGVLIVTGVVLAVLVNREGSFLWVGIIGPMFLAAYVLLVGYVYGDARRRRMRHVMWMWLAILVPNGLGIVIYFILREPLAVYCTTCGLAMRPGFAYCPGCGSAMAPVCTKCQRVSEQGWSHCAFCGAKL